MWSHRRSEEPACTEITCYWKKSKLAEVATDKKFILATEISNKKTTDLLDDGKFYWDVINKLNEKQIDVQLSTYVLDLECKKMYSLSLHQILLAFSLTEERDVNRFIIFAKNSMETKLCENANKNTKQQSTSKLWFELRWGRITASKIHEAARCKTQNGYLVKKIIGCSKVYDTYFMKRGRDLEDEIIKELKKQGIRAQKCGFFLIPQHPIIGASPEAISQEFT